MNKSIKINPELLFQTIQGVARSIENELASINETGIFFVPELHLAFEVGKKIYIHRKEIFGTNELKWVREKNLGNGGPCDLIFENDSESVVFEFKIADTWNSYEKDIKKLQSLPNEDSHSYHKFFVAVVDQFREKQDGRIDYLKSFDQLHLRMESFEVGYSGYQGNINCVLALYRVN
ncbi:hypothetical protein [Algoriphagus terrigena]|uniref:hypothetical protein n=1 Tax=Algoriphagus terrigena TaxID=344884 RepID=UPI000400B9CE|nr:hypothetical protein [Algoriphagus terrigena]